MQRLLTVAVTLAVSLVLAAPSQAAAPTNRQLARQIKALQRQVKTLQKQVKDARLIALGSFFYTGCSIAVTVDAFQGTWGVIDQIPNHTAFGPQVPVSDYGLCAAGQITRTPNKVPPDVSVFSALLAIFRS